MADSEPSAGKEIARSAAADSEDDNEDHVEEPDANVDQLASDDEEPVPATTTRKGKGKRAAPAKVRTPPSSIDEVESEDEDPGEATSTRKGKRKSVAPVAAHAPPAKKARATPAKKTQPAASAKKTVPAGPAKTTRAAAAAAARKMLEVAAKPARRKSQSNTAQSASKEAEPEARALLVQVRASSVPRFPADDLQFKGKYRCRGCSRKDGSTDEVPLCQVYGKSSRCKQCNAGHRDCEISVSLAFFCIWRALTFA